MTNKTKLPYKALDGYENFLARIGGRSGGIATSGGWENCDLLRNNVRKLEAMYSTSWLSARIVDGVAEDMVRAGVSFDAGLDSNIADKMQSSLVELGVWDGVLDLLKLSRLYGGAVGVIVIKGQDLSTPLIIRTVGKGQFEALRVYDCHDVVPDTQNLIEEGKDYGLPMYYDVQMSGADMVKVHHSRIIRQVGIKLPRREAMASSYWGDSVLSRCHDSIERYEFAMGSVANLLNLSLIRTMKIVGFQETLAMGGEAENNMIKAIQLSTEMQTISKMLCVDSTTNVETTAYSFGGIPDVLSAYEREVSGSGKIPIVSLFGQSPAGLSATGESDTRQYYDNVFSMQESSLRTPLSKIFHVLHLSLTGQELPDDFGFSFVPLWQMSDIEKATLAKMTVDSIAVLSSQGIGTTEMYMRELKDSSQLTGVFSGITDDDVAQTVEANKFEPAPELPEIETPEEPLVAVR